MTKHTLFICKSCQNSSVKKLDKQIKDGQILLEKINAVFRDKFPSLEIEVKPVECFWACSRGCVAAICCPEKPTYYLIDLPPDKIAAALLEVMQMYIDDQQGELNWEKVPQILKRNFFGYIPSVKTL